MLHLEQDTLKMEARDLSALEQNTLAQTKDPQRQVFHLQQQAVAVVKKAGGCGMSVLIFPEYPSCTLLWVRAFLSQD